ncbi:MAG: putative Ig domain-containing protein [Chloroflexi bacterium]|nr:putative Ig domain-containing protein [Chloroflexota bacterium]
MSELRRFVHPLWRGRIRRAAMNGVRLLAALTVALSIVPPLQAAAPAHAAAELTPVAADQLAAAVARALDGEATNGAEAGVTTGDFEPLAVVPPEAAITSRASATLTEGRPGGYPIMTTGTPTPTLSETGTLPSGVTFTDNGNGTASLSGTPAAATAGTYNLTITAHNGVGADAVQTLTLTVQAALAGGYPLAWGGDTTGQSGDGLATDQLALVQTLNLTGITAVVSGSSHSLALRSDGTVWTWGKNTNGQLGNNTITTSLTPVQVLGLDGAGFLTGIIAVAAGGASSVALKNDGTVWTWGQGQSGQLGNNTLVQSTTPVQVRDVGGVGFLTGVIAVAEGGFHSLAVKSDGTVWAWGEGSAGRLGNNRTTTSATPVQVMGVGGAGVLNGVARVTAGTHSVAVKTDGTVWS